LSEAPFLLVIAGPNGSGKTTLTNYLLEAGVDFGEYINPDEIAATLDLPEPVRSKQAQAIADVQRDPLPHKPDELQL
jgi:predicted ABC-type ATPase